MFTDNVRFMVLVVDEFVQVQAGPKWTLSTLLDEMKLSGKIPPEAWHGFFKPFNYNVYALKNPIKVSLANKPEIEAQVMASLKDETKYEKLRLNNFMQEISSTFIEDHLYLVMEHSIPDVEELEDSGPEYEDDLGIFGHTIVRHGLDEMNYRLLHVVYGHPNIARIQSRVDGKTFGCLKFVEDRGHNEIKILEYLTSLPASEANHTVRPMRIWRIPGGSIIAMPMAGTHIIKLDDLDIHLWTACVQLFEAVKFMHDHHVAHMDLKPSNILIPIKYGRLTIIDFGLSVRVKSPASLLRGRAGTEGYMAPEIGHTKFSAIRADLWSTGKVVQELCICCRPSRPRDWLLALSAELLDDDPDKRPMMAEVLQRVLNFDLIDSSDTGHISLFAPTSSSGQFAAVGA